MVSHRKQNGSEITSRNYFSEIGQPNRCVKRSAFSEARSNLSWECFPFLLDELNRASEPKLWKGHKVRAADGTYLSLPASKDILELFPRRVCEQNRSHYPKALLVVATDVLNGIPSTARICSSELGDERTLLKAMLDEFEGGDILLLDRGYEGADLLYEIHRRGQYFVARVRSGNSCSNAVKSLLGSSKKSIIVQLQTQSGESYPVRLIKRGRDRKGLPIIVATNLIASNYSKREIFELYLRRWKIETMYLRVKNLFALERFYSKSINGVMQEIWANLFILGLTAYVSGAASESVGRTANFKNAAEVVRRFFHYAVSTCLTPRQASKAARTMIAQIESCYCCKQPGRKNVRISKQPGNKWNIHRPLTRNRPKNRRKKDA